MIKISLKTDEKENNVKKKRSTKFYFSYVIVIDKTMEKLV